MDNFIVKRAVRIHVFPKHRRHNDLTKGDAAVCAVAVKYRGTPSRIFELLHAREVGLTTRAVVSQIKYEGRYAVAIID
jgi:hypothetical protein